MKLILFAIILLLFFISCTSKTTISYDSLTAQQCDSLLKTAVLSSRERASILTQYAILYSPYKGVTEAISSTNRRQYLKMLKEALAIAPTDLKNSIRIELLPFYLSDLPSNGNNARLELRNLIGELECSNLSPKQEAWYLIYKSQYYNIQDASEEASLLCKKARKIFQAIKNKKGEFNSLLQSSMIHTHLKNHPQALLYCDSAQDLQGYSRTINDRQRLYNNYSLLYQDMGEYDKAIEARKRAGSDTINNYTLTHLYIQAGRYREALNSIKTMERKTVSNAFQQNFYLRMAASIHEAIGHKDSAALLREEAIRMAEENAKEIQKKRPGIIGIPRAFIPIYFVQGQWMWNKGNQTKALDLFQRAAMLANGYGSVTENNIFILNQIADYYKQAGNYKEALGVIIQRDSIRKEFDQQNITTHEQNLASIHEVELLNATANVLKTERSYMHYCFYLLATLAIISILFILLFIRHHRFRKKQSAQIHQQTEEIKQLRTLLNNEDDRNL